jgi:transcriptional regulator with XRE-family HTH domain
MKSKTPGRKAAHAACGNTLLEAFQNALESLRHDMGLSRCAFATRLGIPRSSYFHLMTDAANPSLDYIELIAERAGVEPITFLGQAKVQKHAEPQSRRALS